MSATGPVAIAVAGAGGRMGREVLRLIHADPAHYHLAAAWVPEDGPDVGRDAGELCGTGRLEVTCETAGRLPARAEAVVDFSTPGACVEIAAAAVDAGAALVCGTTGLNRDAEAALDRAAQHVPVLHAANFSFGIAVLSELVRLAGTRLGAAFDVEILEAHHRGKRDAPSGTARMLGRMLGDEAGAIRTGPRKNAEVGYGVLRGGAVAGEHTVFFLGDHERLELTHRVADRGVFASGALRAARALVGRKPGRYALTDVLTDADGD